MRNLKFAAKIYLLLAFFVLIGGGVTTFLLYRVSAVNSSYQEMMSSGEVRARASSRSLQLKLRKQVQEWQHLLLRGHEPEALAQYSKNLQQEEQSVKQAALELKELISDPEMKSV